MNQALLHRELNGRFKRPHSCFKLALIHALETCEPVDFVRVFKLNRAPALPEPGTILGLSSGHRNAFAGLVHVHD
jgi:hypothetical protein